MPQTPDVVTAAWDASRAAVVGTLRPQSYDRAIVLASITGPSNSTLTIYRGYVIHSAFAMTTVYPADVRTYDSDAGNVDRAPMKLHAGEAATFAWTGGASGAGQTATATIRSEY